MSIFLGRISRMASNCAINKGSECDFTAPCWPNWSYLFKARRSVGM